MRQVNDHPSRKQKDRKTKKHVEFPIPSIHIETSITVCAPLAKYALVLPTLPKIDINIYQLVWLLCFATPPNDYLPASTAGVARKNQSSETTQ